MQVTAHIRLDDESSVSNSQKGGTMKLLNMSMASPSNGDTSMADFSMASISMDDAGSSNQDDDARSSKSDDSGTQVVRVDKKKPKAATALANLKAVTLDKLDEVEGEEDT